jgi:hypothetical protein
MVAQAEAVFGMTARDYRQAEENDQEFTSAIQEEVSAPSVCIPVCPHNVKVGQKPVYI